MMNKIRVLHIIPNYGPGGAERVAYHILTHLDRSRFDVATLTLFDHESSELEHLLSEADIPHTTLGKRLGFDPRMFSRLYQALKRLRPHVVHTHRVVLPYALPALMTLRIPVSVHTVHSLAHRELGWHGRLAHYLAFRLGVQPVSIAEAVTETLERVYGSLRFRLIPNGIPVRLYQQPRTNRSAWRRREGIPDDAFLVVHVGRMDLVKNQALLLQAFARIRNQVPRAWLVHAGDGPLREPLAEQAQALGIAYHVRFLGLRDDIPDVLGASDVFVLSSEWEGHPLCVMEAMAAGLPVVSTRVGGVHELVGDGTNGRLVPPGNAEALSDAVVALAQNPALMRTMGQDAASKALATFDVQIMADAYATLYLELLAREVGPVPPLSVKSLDRPRPSAVDQNLSHA